MEETKGEGKVGKVEDGEEEEEEGGCLRRAALM